MSCTTAKTCRWPPHFSCFSSTSMKRKLKQDCIITPRMMARNTMSSPWLNGAVRYSRIWPSPFETKDITVPDILLETEVDTEAIQLIIIINACTLASRMLDREKPCGPDHSWCLILPRLPYSQKTQLIFVKRKCEEHKFA